MRLNPQFALQPPQSRCPYEDQAQCEREVTALHIAGLK
jgi:hypothetical protein